MAAENDIYTNLEFMQPNDSHIKCLPVIFLTQNM